MSATTTEWAECPAAAVDEVLRWVTPKMLAARAMKTTLLYPLRGTEDADGKPIHVEITINLQPSAELLERQAKSILEAAGVHPR